MPAPTLVPFSLCTVLEKEEKVATVLWRYDFRHRRSQEPVLQIEANHFHTSLGSSTFSQVLSGASINILYTGMLCKAPFLQVASTCSALLGSARLTGLSRAYWCAVNGFHWVLQGLWCLPVHLTYRCLPTEAAYAICFEHKSAWAHHPSLSTALSVLFRSHSMRRCTFFGLLPSLFKSVMCAAGLTSSGWAPTC